MHRVFKELGQLPIEVDGAPPSETLPRVVILARRHQLTTYDATCLELAVRGKMPLATFDSALAAAARKEEVEPFEG